MQINKEADFVLKNGRAVYPPIVNDESLKLYYDVKGKKNGDVHKDKLLDMSGQGKDGELHNFSYKNLSGYQEDNGLVFDGIDGKLELGEVEDINPDSFTYQLNNNIISYGEDGTVKWVKDGKMMERKGINLVRNGNFSEGSKYIEEQGMQLISNDGVLTAKIVGPYNRVYFEVDFKTSNIYLITIRRSEVTRGSIGARTITTGSTPSRLLETISNSPEGVYYFTPSEDANGLRLNFARSSPGSEVEIEDVQVINLTATFGAGNEPTLEEIQAEPDKWQWLPNPIDLLEAKELKGNILGDMEDIVDASPRDSQSGKEIFTEHADDSHVEVEVDGQSYQHAGGGKNLFIPQSTWVEDTIDGEEVWRFKNYFMENIFKENTQYTFRARARYSGGYVVSLRFNYTDGTYSQSTYFFDSMGNRSLTSDAGKTVKSAGFYQVISDNDAYHIVAVKDSIQLEEGSTANEYELPTPTPDYPVEIHSLNDVDVVSSVEKLSEGQLQEYDYNVEYENVDKIKLLLSEPLRSVGDVKDRLFRDSDGLWKVERNVGGEILDGTENWAQGSDNLTDVFRYYSASVTLGSESRNADIGTCSHLRTNSYAVQNQEGATFGLSNMYPYLFLNKTEYPTTESVKSWILNESTKGTPVVLQFRLENPTIETLDQNFQDKLNNLRSFHGSNYVYTVQNKDNPHKEQLTPTLHATFSSKDYLKETRILTNLLIWARELTDEEFTHHNQLFLNRFNLPSDRVIGELIKQTLNLLHGGMVGHSLEQNYTINI